MNYADVTWESGGRFTPNTQAADELMGRLVADWLVRWEEGTLIVPEAEAPLLAEFLEMHGLTVERDED